MTNSPPPPESWGDLDLLDEIDPGPLCSVFLARDRQFSRNVILKLYSPQENREDLRADALLREGEILAAVSHPNLVEIYGAAIRAGRLGIWMEIVEGRTLGEIVRSEGPLGPAEVYRIGIDLCRALAALHRTYVIHRAIHPENVRKDPRGRIVLMDPRAGGAGGACPAPEIESGAESTERTDLFGAGALLYFLLTGSQPSSSADASKLDRRPARGADAFIPESNTEMTAELAHVIERALAHDPADRFDSAHAMERALLGALKRSTRRRSARPESWRRRVNAVPSWIRWSASLLLAVGVWLLFATPDFLRSSVYTVEVSLIRADASGLQEISPEPPIDPGNEFFLEVETSVMVYLYVVSTDGRNEPYLLFPLPDQTLSNPFPPHEAHRLPADGEESSPGWDLASLGKRGQLILVGSSERLTRFEEIVDTLRPPLIRGSREAMLLTGESMAALFELIDEPGPAPSEAMTDPAGFFSRARLLGPGPLEVEGAWTRRVDWEYPQAQARP